MGSTREPPGRSCPLHYRYRPEDIAATDAWPADPLYVVGGLYGNRQALDEVRRMAAAEPRPATLCFNGDFHWFDADPEGFAAIDDEVARHLALRGNVETEIADPDLTAGCGCAYPESVDAGTVERSNQIIARLRGVAQRFPRRATRLAALPMWRVAEVGELRVGIVHGDAESLSGWGFAAETADSAPAAARAVEHAARAAVAVFASSHTCLPVMRCHGPAAGGVILVNNGAAGMPNFSGERFGVITRIATTAPPQPALYGRERDGVFVHALAVRYDHEAFLRDFDRWWPADSPASISYRTRIVDGPDWRTQDARPHP